MWWLWIIFCAILSFLGLVIIDYHCTFLDVNKKWISDLGNLLLIIGIMLLPGAICFVGDSKKSKEPTALDVYRGKTTLQITYQNSIPIDSVVVFKNK